MIAAAKKTAVKTKLDTASCKLPLMPWPLVQPEASRAPNIISNPAKNAAVSRSDDAAAEPLPPHRRDGLGAAVAREPGN